MITFQEYSRLVIRIKRKFYTGCILSLSGFSFAEAPSLPSGYDGHIVFNCCVSMGSSNAWQFLILSIFHGVDTFEVQIIYQVLGWYKNNCGLALLNFAVWYQNMFFYKCGYVIHHFNTLSHFIFFLLVTYYLLFILYLF